MNDRDEIFKILCTYYPVGAQEEYNKVIAYIESLEKLAKEACDRADMYAMESGTYAKRMMEAQEARNASQAFVRKLQEVLRVVYENVDRDEDTNELKQTVTFAGGKITLDTLIEAYL